MTTTANITLRQQIAEALLGRIEWIGAGKGACDCPAAALHTSATRRRHTMVFLEGAPTVQCVHSSCRPAVEELNHRLRVEIGKAERGTDWKPDPAEVEQRQAERLARTQSEAEEAQLVETAGRALEKILSRWAWSEVDAWEASPIRLDGPPEEDHRLFLHHVFDPEAVLWIGERHESGRPEHKANFRTAAEWCALPASPAPLVCPSIFRPGSFSRSTDNVVASRFLVVEADAADPIVAAKATRAAAIRANLTAGKIESPRAELLLSRYQLTDEDRERNRAGCLALTRWLREECRLRLRAVVDAGNRSCHAWFDRPPDSIIAELVALAPGLKLDPATFRPAQPVRLPGYKRETGRFQRLLFLEGNHV
jgi:hypothetical protein